MLRGERPRALRLARIPRLAAIALLAVEQLAKHERATLLANHPRPLNPRRPVSNVLEVAAGELRHPVPLSVEVEAGDGSIHATRIKMPVIAIASTRMLPMSTLCLQLRSRDTHRFDVSSLNNGRNLAPEQNDHASRKRDACDP